MKSQSIFRKSANNKFLFDYMNSAANTKLFEYMAHIGDAQHVKFIFEEIYSFLH